MGLPREVVAAVRRMDEGQLRQVLILARGLLLTSEAPVVQVDDIPGMPTVRYRQREVRCGKATCTACPHGPYWYAHWTEGGRRRSRYIGGELPAEVRRKLEDLDAARRVAAAGVEVAGVEVADDAAMPARRQAVGGGTPPPVRRGLRLVDGG